MLELKVSEMEPLSPDASQRRAIGWRCWDAAEKRATRVDKQGTKKQQCCIRLFRTQRSVTMMRKSEAKRKGLSQDQSRQCMVGKGHQQMHGEVLAGWWQLKGKSHTSLKVALWNSAGAQPALWT